MSTEHYLNAAGVALILLSVAVPLWGAMGDMRTLSSRDARFKAARAEGTRVTARVLSLQQTGVFFNRNPEVMVSLLVDVHGTPYEATLTDIILMRELPLITPGSEVQVAIHPEDPHMVALCLNESES